MVTEILLIGGSAGSISVLLEVLPHIDKDIRFPIVIVLHRKAYPESILNVLFGFYSKLPVVEAYDKMTLDNATVYVAPADYHLLFEDRKTVSLDSSEKVNYSRPSIDVIFQSAAEVFGSGTTALLLSGANSDGVDGLICIERQQGKILIQSPDTAEYDLMPRTAKQNLTTYTEVYPKEIAFQINHLETK